MATRGIKLNVTLDPGNVPEDIARWIQKTNNWSGFLEDVGDIISKEMEYNFIRAPWPALAASTVLKKTKLGYPLDILVETGALRDAAAAGRWDVGPSEATLGVPGYGAFHIDGTSMMPARDFTLMPASVGPQIQAALEAYLSD